MGRTPTPAMMQGLCQRYGDAQLLPAFDGRAPLPTVRQDIFDSPRVRLVHNFVSAAEAEEIIRVATRLYHRSSTARGGADEKRTSYSASLPPSGSEAVRAVRRRIAAYCGYPEANLEPLQAVRYREGEFYRHAPPLRARAAPTRPRHVPTARPRGAGRTTTSTTRARRGRWATGTSRS